MKYDLSSAPAASALPLTAERADPIRLFLTWTTYGTWLPGDNRGWRKERKGTQPPQPRLEEWCRDQMKDSPVVLTVTQRNEVESVIREHCEVRGWELGAVSARSNHVHVAVTVILPVSGKALAAGESAPVSGKALAAGNVTPVSGKALAAAESAPVNAETPAAGHSPTTNHPNSSSALKRVRDQFKANGTRVLKKYPELSAREKIWTKGGDIQIIDTDDDWEQVLLYIVAAQDRMERGK